MPFPRRMPQPREKDDSICSSSSPSPPPSARFTFDALAASARTRSSARELTPRERSHGVARVWTKGRAPRGGEGRDRTNGEKWRAAALATKNVFRRRRSFAFTCFWLYLLYSLRPQASSPTAKLCSPCLELACSRPRQRRKPGTLLPQK